jgi:hypothetical protein
MKDGIIGSVFFAEAAITVGVYLDNLEKFVYPR